MRNVVSVLEGAYSQVVTTDIPKSLIMEIRPCIITLMRELKKEEVYNVS